MLVYPTTVPLELLFQKDLLSCPTEIDPDLQIFERRKLTRTTNKWPQSVSEVAAQTLAKPLPQYKYYNDGVLLILYINKN